MIPPQGTHPHRAPCWDITKVKLARLCRNGNTPKYSHQSNIPINGHGVGTSVHYHGPFKAPPQDHDAALPAPSLQAQLAVFALPSAPGILPVLIAHRPFDRTLHVLREPQLKQIVLTARGSAPPSTGSLPKLESPRTSHGRCVPDRPGISIGGVIYAWRCAVCRARRPPPAPAADCPPCSNDSCDGRGF
jgi:hypothetical protein